MFLSLLAVFLGFTRDSDCRVFHSRWAIGVHVLIGGLKRGLLILFFFLKNSNACNLSSVAVCNVAMTCMSTKRVVASELKSCNVLGCSHCFLYMMTKLED